MQEVTRRRINPGELGELPVDYSKRFRNGEVIGAIATEALTKLDVIEDVNGTFQQQLLDRILPETAYAPVVGLGVDIGRDQL